MRQAKKDTSYAPTSIVEQILQQVGNSFLVREINPLEQCRIIITKKSPGQRRREIAEEKMPMSMLSETRASRNVRNMRFPWLLSDGAPYVTGTVAEVTAKVKTECPGRCSHAAGAMK